MAVSAMIVSLAASTAMQGWQATHRPDAPKFEPPKTSTPEQADDSARKAAERRRSMYAGMGRSSTILTGPGGTSGGAAVSDPSQPKMLLGL